MTGRILVRLAALVWLSLPAASQTAAQWAAEAYAHLSAGRDGPAIEAFEQALAADPPPHERYQLAADLGFALNRLSRWEEAAAAFSLALAVHDDPLLRRARAYALKAAGQTTAAADAFRAAMIHDPAMPAEREELLRREVRDMSRRLIGQTYVQLRAEPAFDAVTVTDPPVVGSQGGAELAVRLVDRLGLEIRPTARLLWAFDAFTFAAVDDSLQAGIGVQIKPFRRRNLILSAERLIAIGDFARNDWLLRASWSEGLGYEGAPGRRIWPFFSVYLDAAVIAPVMPDLIVAADVRAGLGWRVHERVTLRPILAASALMQEGFGDVLELIEAGPGMRLILTPPGTRLRASSVAIEIEARWRQKIAGDAGNRSGFTLTLALRF